MFRLTPFSDIVWGLVPSLGDTKPCSCRSRKLARKWRSRKRSSLDVHEAMTRWVQSGTHVVPEYPCHNPAFRSFSLTTCRFIPFPIYLFLLPLCTKHVACTAIFSTHAHRQHGAPGSFGASPCGHARALPPPQGRPPRWSSRPI